MTQRTLTICWVRASTRGRIVVAILTVLHLACLPKLPRIVRILLWAGIHEVRVIIGSLAGALGSLRSVMDG